MRQSDASRSTKWPTYGIISEETNQKPAKPVNAGTTLEQMDLREAGEEVTGKGPGIALDAPNRYKKRETRKC